MRSRFNAALALGELLGPIVAGYVAEYFSYDRTLSLLGIFIIIVNILYLPLMFMNFEPDKTKKVEVHE
jgi:MFS family permease